MGITLGTAKDFSVETLLLFAVESRTVAGGVGDPESTDTWDRIISRAKWRYRFLSKSPKDFSPVSTSLATQVLHCPPTPPRRHLQLF